MTEGWHNDDYLALFDQGDEAERMTAMYGLGDYLPGYTVIGLRGWDDFIVRDAGHRLFTIPTVPLDPAYLSAFELQVDQLAIAPDARYQGRVKWYVKPIVFGGNPTEKENMVWISYKEHAKFVRWWNKVYRDVASKNRGANNSPEATPGQRPPAVPSPSSGAPHL